MTKTLLLFDIDGTILRSGGAGMRAMYRVAAKLHGSHHKWDGIESGGNLDPALYAEFLARNKIVDQPAGHDVFHDHYLAELKQEFEQSRKDVQALPGVHDVIAMLHERAAKKKDVVLGLLTGNYTRAVPIKLEAVGVDTSWFAVTAFGDEGKTRPDLVVVAMKKYEKLTGHRVDPRKVIVIGDTPRDVACAHAHGCVAAAVATGSFTVDQLRATGAELVLPDLADPAPLLKLIEGSGAA